MKLVQGFFIYDMDGRYEESWFNMDHIRNFKYTDCHLRDKSVTIKSIELDMGAPYLNKTPYLHANVALTVRELEELVVPKQKAKKSKYEGYIAQSPH